MQIGDYLKTKRLIADGAMGTYFEKKYPEEEGMAEACNLTDPDKIRRIHAEYIRNGAKLIRTNTFAANTMFFEDLKTVKAVVRAGFQMAQEAVKEAGEEIFVAADIGPIYDPQFLGKEQVLAEYYAICDTFLDCGAEIFVLETQSEFTYIEEVAAYLKEKADVFFIVQFSLDRSGYTRNGLSMEQIIKKAALHPAIDAYGFNCGVGAAHLCELMEKVTFPNDKYVTALPNAGYPVELRGKTIYGDNRGYFVGMMKKLAGLGVEILGGCCGTTPEYIRDVCTALETVPLCEKKIEAQAAAGRISRMVPAAMHTTKTTGGRFCRMLEEGEKIYIVELDPPFDTDITKVMQGAETLREAGADLLTLADSPMARARMDAGKLAAKVQREVKIPVMPHICCRDKNMIAMRSGILGDYMNDLRHFLVVTGDPVGRESRGVITPVFDFNSIRFMEYLSGMNEDVFAKDPVYYGGALNYHGANPDAICERVRRKMETGCGMFLTQPVYSAEDMEQLFYIREKTGAKLMCGIMPPVSYKNAGFMANEMPGIRIPQEIVARYTPEMSREEAETVGIELAVGLAHAMQEFADGYYFMTPFNRASMIAKILQCIKGLRGGLSCKTEGTEEGMR